MKFLLDTHLLLWAAATPDRLSPACRDLLLDPANDLVFSSASLWEITIKQGLGRNDFQVDPARLWRQLREHGYEELPVTSAHAVAVQSLPPIHRDPFDRILIAQATQEAITLLTADEKMARYGAPVQAA